MVLKLCFKHGSFIKCRDSRGGTDGVEDGEEGRALRWEQQTLIFNLGSSKVC